MGTSNNRAKSLSREREIRTVTANTEITGNDDIVFADATAGNVVVILPLTTGVIKRHYTIKKIDSSANTVTLSRTDPDTIEGANTYVMTKEDEFVEVHAKSGDWRVIASSASTEVTVDEIITTQGDIIQGGSGGTGERLAKGASGTFLKAGAATNAWAALAASDVQSGTFADARISESSVTQHEGAINHDNLTGIVALEHLDWTQDQGANNIDVNNIPQSSLAIDITQVTNGIKEVDDYTELRAITSPTTTPVVCVRHRSASGDMGGGEFIWVSGDKSTEVAADEVTASEGDGGRWVAPASDKTGASGAWMRQWNMFLGLSVKWYGAKGDGSTDDTAAFLAAIASSYDRVLHIPDGDYVVTEQLDLTSRITISGQSKQFTRIFCKGTPTKSVQTYVTHKTAYDSGTYTSSDDSSIAACFAVTAAQVHIEKLQIFGWYDATVQHTTPYASYPLEGDSEWDVGILVQVPDFSFDKIIVSGLFNVAGMLVDVSQPNGSTDRLNGFDSELGGRYGLKIQGAEGSGSYPNFSDMNANDTRGAGGASDMNFFSVNCYGTDIKLNTDLGLRYVRRFTSDAGGLHISGQLSANSAKRIQGIRFFGCRFASYDPDSLNMNFCNRVEFFGCHTEFRAGGYDTDGTTALTSGDFTGVTSEANSTNIKFFGGERSGEADNLTYSDATNGNLVSVFARDNGSEGAETLIHNIKDTGTWTPVLYGAGTAGTPTYTVQTADYERIGNIVSAQCRVAISAKGGIAGNIAISGLPYKNKAAANTENGGSIALFSNVTFSGQLTAIVENNSSEIQFYDCTTGAGASRISDSEITDSFSIIVSVTYKTDDVVSI